MNCPFLTGYERDGETGLDYAQARYFSNVQGRFTVTDPLLSTGRPDNPQTWNRYSYVLNNPLIYVDPSGMFVFARNVSAEDQQKIINAWVALNQSLNEHKEGSEAYKNIKRSLDRLGKPGKANGIIVTIGATRPEADASTDVNRINRGEVTITFNRDLFNSLDEAKVSGALGHEGIHADDGYRLYSQSSSMGDFARRFTNHLYHSEFEAFFVSAGVHEVWKRQTPLTYQTEVRIPGQRLGLPGSDDLWNPAWANLDRQTIESKQSSAINALLQTPRTGNYGAYGYGLRPGQSRYKR